MAAFQSLPLIKSCPRQSFSVPGQIDVKLPENRISLLGFQIQVYDSSPNQFLFHFGSPLSGIPARPHENTSHVALRPFEDRTIPNAAVGDDPVPGWSRARRPRAVSPSRHHPCAGFLNQKSEPRMHYLHSWACSQYKLILITKVTEESFPQGTSHSACQLN